MFERLGLIGCGLMGSSFALAMKEAGLVQRVTGYSKSPTTTAKALEKGIIDTEASSALMAVSGADIVLIAIPVISSQSMFRTIKHGIKPDTLVMDVGSTKQNIVEAARKELGELVGTFVPAHPVAGKESSGVDSADEDLYKNRQVILTPIERTFTTQLQKAQQLWQSLGCHVTQMSPKAHDAAFAAISHMPHLLSFGLLNSLTAQEQGSAFLEFAGPGFRDFTRIAASDPKVWREILIANHSEILAQIKNYSQVLSKFETLLQEQDADALEAYIRNASRTRKNWSMSVGNSANTSATHKKTSSPTPQTKFPSSKLIL